MPGLCVAEEIRRRWPEGDVLFLGTEKAGELKWMATFAFQRRPLRSKPLTRSLAKLPGCVLGNAAAFFQSIGVLRRFGPDVVVGLGGYGSLPPVLCAKMLGLPVLLLEQNVIPGRANRMLSRFADEIDCQWVETREHLARPDRVCVTGNPIRSNIARRDEPADPRDFGLEPGAKTLLIMGGSQGASPINNAVCSALLPLCEKVKGVQVIHLTGPHDLDKMQQRYAAAGVRAFVREYYGDIASLYDLADLALCRAGATSIAELTAAGLPAVFIPLPHAANDHQTKNAELLAHRGAAVVLRQSDLTADTLVAALHDLLTDEERLAAMRRRNLDIAVPDAAAAVVDRIARLIDSRSLRHGAHAHSEAI